jgi:hypothetical protein
MDLLTPSELHAATKKLKLRFEVITAVTMKNAVFLGRGVVYILCEPTLWGNVSPPSTLKMEAIRSSETSVRTRCRRCHIPEDSIFQETLNSKPLLTYSSAA